MQTHKFMNEILSNFKGSSVKASINTNKNDKYPLFLKKKFYDKISICARNSSFFLAIQPEHGMSE